MRIARQCNLKAGVDLRNGTVHEAMKILAPSRQKVNLAGLPWESSYIPGRFLESA